MPDARGACRTYDWDLIQSFPAPPDLPPRGRGTARRRWKEFVTITGLRGIATMRCICICELHCCRLGNVESSSADDGTRSARPRGLGGDFEFLPLKSPRNPITPIETSRVATLHPGLYTRIRECARRVIGATAKPLYPIDGKAGGLDRRNPRPPSSREGDRPQAVEGVRNHYGVTGNCSHEMHLHL